MILTYHQNKNTSPLVEEYYELLCEKECIPFQTTILPFGVSNITYIFSEGQKAIVDKLEVTLFGLMISGQFYKSYKFLSAKEGSSFGLTFHPTAIHKLLGIDFSKLQNKHIPLKTINEEYYNQLNTIFKNYSNPKNAVIEIEEFLSQTKLHINQNTIMIDKVIDLIRKKDGLLNIEEILFIIQVSQKTLETQFKKIVGITPGRYIRLFRFLNLMKKYEKQEIDLKDLIYMYNYYDSSHFNKDFKLFMNESPTAYFSKEHPFIKKILKN